MKLLATVFALLLLTGCNVSFSSGEKNDQPQTASGSQEQQKEAEAAALSYLAMIDNNEFDKTWDLSGPALRAQSNKFAWTSMLKMARKTFAVGSRRELDGFGFSTRIDSNAPVGDYVLVQFKGTSGRVTTTEKVVMQKDQGTWKIVGYFVNKHAQLGSGT